MKRPIAVIIPAAGESSRMGKPKALLEYAPGVTISAHLTEVYKRVGCKPVVMVISEQSKVRVEEFTDCLLVVNDRLDLGRQHSIRLGLEQVPGETACFLHNIDNPCADPDLLLAMMGTVEEEGYVVPVWKDVSGHPVLLGNSVVDHLKNAGQFDNLRSELNRFRKIEVPWPDQRICQNINTPEDYLEFKNQKSKFKI